MKYKSERLDVLISVSLPNDVSTTKGSLIKNLSPIFSILPQEPIFYILPFCTHLYFHLVDLFTSPFHSCLFLTVI